ncbi:MAG: type III toxin-antitoxin system ToxN/AbiQ family toxin [Lachnospiraceae bacterium]|nr:type III toxin-antitoxin system ToxN/AbiQ family toxin [Lachnospiraceae bacterium]
MKKLELYEVSEKYISYLRTFDNYVLSSKDGNRTHTRKYLGVVLQINDYNYYVPLSSPKHTDYQLINGKPKIRKSVIPIIRITSLSSSGEEELKGTLKFSNMIPVPNSELTIYDVENELDKKYKALIQKELLFIRKNRERIIKNAITIYNQKTQKLPNITYLDNTVNFILLEQKHDEFLTLRSK